MKKYTKIRRFYAWVGLITLIALIAVGIFYVPTAIEVVHDAYEFTEK